MLAVTSFFVSSYLVDEVFGLVLEFDLAIKLVELLLFLRAKKIILAL